MQESANQDYFGYYKRKIVANLYLDLKDKYLERRFVLRYEKAIYDPVAIYIWKLFTNQHKKIYYAVYKNKSVKDSWCSELVPYIILEIMAELQGTRL